ncbi:unnamed protein product [Orchesella dallaii]|uniref:Ionotropic glutamate receptor L-glutamate and glycine-binding domain-containing protein n=1 Tax=Orchesella dallaii TaxID=48710 RepID=A0ABP1PUY5_9HEXA
MSLLNISSQIFWYFMWATHTMGTSEFEKGNMLSPCLAKNSILFNGSCLQCIRPNQPYINCGNEIENLITEETTSNCNNVTDQMYLCPTQQTDIEQLKISEGKQYLNQRTLRVVTIERLPFVKIIDGNYSGVILEYLYALQLKYNFTSNIFLPYDGNWGAETDNGTWNGMIGQVLRNEAELGANAFSVTLERAKVIAFSMPFHQEPAAILIPAPREGNKLAILIRPLSNEVWLAVFTTILVLVPFLFVMHVTSLRIRGEVTKLKFADGVRLILDLFQFTIGSLVQESKRRMRQKDASSTI